MKPNRKLMKMNKKKTDAKSEHVIYENRAKQNINRCFIMLMHLDN